MEHSQGQKCVLCPKEELAYMPVMGTQPGASLAIDVWHHHQVRPDDDMRVYQEPQKGNESQMSRSNF